MKKHILLIATALLLGISAQAQELAYQKGDNILNAGFGFGYYAYNYSFNRSFSIPALTSNYEVGVHEYFGVGPYVGFGSWNYSGIGFDGGFSIFTLGARASFHYAGLLNEALDMGIGPKWDLYVALLVGLNFETYSGDFTAFEENEVSPTIGPTLGFRYYITDKFGIYLEGGRGSFGYGNLGISIKM